MREMQEQVETALRTCEKELREQQEVQKALRAQLKELEQVEVYCDFV